MSVPPVVHLSSRPPLCPRTVTLYFTATPSFLLLHLLAGGPAFCLPFASGLPPLAHSQHQLGMLQGLSQGPGSFRRLRSWWEQSAATSQHPPSPPSPRCGPGLASSLCTWAVSQEHLSLPPTRVQWGHAMLTSKPCRLTAFFKCRESTPLPTLLRCPGFSEDLPTPRARRRRVTLPCHLHANSSKEFWEQNGLLGLSPLGFCDTTMTGIYFLFYDTDWKENDTQLTYKCSSLSSPLPLSEMLALPPRPTEYFHSREEVVPLQACSRRDAND